MEKHKNTAIWHEKGIIFMVNQNKLPYEFEIFKSANYKETAHAIKTMITRGAGSIGAAAAYAMMQAIIQAPEENYKEYIITAKQEIESTRPTARDLFAATDRVYKMAFISKEKAITEAENIAKEISAAGKKIGEFGNSLLTQNSKILTHCNAGWLALVENGSALAPIYEAFKLGKDIFVYADETRPRSQGARLTAWELNKAGVNHAIIPDNAAAWYMSLGKIDIIITGADRIAANGDTANKIGTLEKAIAAKEYDIPFYIAAPLSTFDINTKSGKDIIIEERDNEEVLYQTGIDSEGKIKKIQVASPGSNAVNPAFDVTNYKYITAFITEKGIFKPEELYKILK